VHLLREDPCPPKTRADLEWDRVLAALAARCAGPLGRGLSLSLPFETTRDGVRAALAEAAEATRLLADGRALPVGEVPDVGDAVERARIGGVLSPAEILAVGRMLGAARSLRRFLASRREDVPALFSACATDPTLDDLADEIADSFDPDGTLNDRASPRLRELRGEWHSARQRMLARMEDLMARYEGVLRDRFVTEREGRWVLPVRSDSHERFPGIVHATSTSGGTLFIEPRAVIPMGNRLKVLDAEVRREEEAVYARLTSLVADHLGSVEAAARALALADVRAATARLAQDASLVFPDVVDTPRLELLRARHLLLALDLPTVVPSDLRLEARSVMVVSGPNAGGKTVALKTMGLAALLVRAGLPVPCAEGSTVGMFDVVLTDVGDDQSLTKNLSTFSAHISNITAILAETTEGALVLLDEVAGGTDPREGEALAAGLLDSLCVRGGAVAATTHYEGLKALALVDSRFVNASVGFDIATMTPTFLLAMGVPGSSSALAVARRFGMPSTVIDRAVRFLTREDLSFEAVVKKLHDERAALELARMAAEDRERQAEVVRVRLDAELTAAKSRENRLLSDEGRELLERIRRARDDLRAAQARLRAKKVEPDTLREAERAIDKVAAQVALGGALEPQAMVGTFEEPRGVVRAADLRRGTRVWVQRLRAEADVVDVFEGGQVRVAAGALKLTVAVTELREVTRPEVAPARAAAARGRGGVRVEPLDEAPTQTRDNTCDLRGLRVDDALAMAMSFLDRAIGAGAHAVFFVHGYGTGALRDAVRKELSQSTCVARVRSAPSDEGGEGVTIAWLA
jgi:DNA mismatch repair protein MutS2